MLGEVQLFVLCVAGGIAADGLISATARDAGTGPGTNFTNHSPIAAARANVSLITLHLPPDYSSTTSGAVPLLIRATENRPSCSSWFGVCVDGQLLVARGYNTCNVSYVQNDDARFAQVRNVRLSVRSAATTSFVNSSVARWTKSASLPIDDLCTRINSSLPLPCSLFVRDGVYRVSLTAKIDRDGQRVTLAESGAMRLSRSVSGEFEYDLRTVSHYVYPCPLERGLPVSFRRPATTATCRAGLAYEAIRVYAGEPWTRERTTGGDYESDRVFLKLKLTYVAEEKLPVGDEQRTTSAWGLVYFSCSHFDLIYPEHCFQFVSAYTGGTVVERAWRCVRTQSSKYAPTPGQWSSWQPWGPCTFGCDQAAIQHRMRYCDKPKPQDGGQFCEGNGLETRPCLRSLVCQEPSIVDLPVTRKPTRVCHRCVCGCNLSRYEGDVVSIGRGDCCSDDILRWNVSAMSRRQRVEVKVLSIRFRNPQEERLTIREADGHDVLFDSSVAADLVRSSVVHARGSSLLVEYVSPPKTAHGEEPADRADDDPVGVLLKYRFVPAAGHSVIDTDGRWWAGLMANKRYSVAVLVCVALVSITFLALVYFLSCRYTFARLRSKRRFLTTTTEGAIEPAPCATDSTPLTEDNCGLSVSRTADAADPRDWRNWRVQKRRRQRLEGVQDLMQTSTRTETTRLSGVTQSSVSPDPAVVPGSLTKATPKSVRSIGIQLSSPALSSLARRPGTNRYQPNVRRPPASSPCVEPSLRLASPSVSEQDDFEYDYYDAPVPGSFFNYDRAPAPGGFVTDIDIDDIIEQSDLMKPLTNGAHRAERSSSTAVATASISTQSQPASELAGSAESSEWSFKWTKPSVAMTQFHFL